MVDMLRNRERAEARPGHDYQTDGPGPPGQHRPQPQTTDDTAPPARGHGGEAQKPQTGNDQAATETGARNGPRHREQRNHTQPAGQDEAERIGRNTTTPNTQKRALPKEPPRPPPRKGVAKRSGPQAGARALASHPCGEGVGAKMRRPAWVISHAAPGRPPGRRVLGGDSRSAAAAASRRPAAADQDSRGRGPRRPPCRSGQPRLQAAIPCAVSRRVTRPAGRSTPQRLGHGQPRNYRPARCGIGGRAGDDEGHTKTVPPPPGPPRRAWRAGARP